MENKEKLYKYMPFIFFGIIAVILIVSGLKYKQNEKNGVKEASQDAQTVEYMGIAIGNPIYTNENELDKENIPIYFYIGGDYFEPDKEYEFDLWEMPGNAVYTGDEVVEQYVWTYDVTIADTVLGQMADEISVDYGEPLVDGTTYTWSRDNGNTLGDNESLGSVVMEYDGTTLTIIGSVAE